MVGKRTNHRVTESTEKTSREKEIMTDMKSQLFSLLVLSSLCPLCLCGENPPLPVRLEALAKSHKGTVAIAVKHLRTGEEFYLNADEPLPTASLIKLAVMVEAFQQ